MKKYTFLILITLSIFFFSSAAYSEQYVNVLGYTPFAYQRMTVTNATVRMLNVTNAEIAGAVFITVETTNVRYRIDGGNPTDVEGHLLSVAAYQNLWLSDPSSIRNFRVLSTGANATLIITFYRRN